MFRTRWTVDGAALVRPDKNVASGRIPLSTQRETPRTRATSAECGRAARLEISPFNEDAAHRLARLDRQDLHDATHRIRAVQIAAATADDFDAVDRGMRHLVPIHPTAERIVER